MTVHNEVYKKLQIQFGEMIVDIKKSDSEIDISSKP